MWKPNKICTSFGGNNGYWFTPDVVTAKKQELAIKVLFAVSMENIYTAQEGGKFKSLQPVEWMHAVFCLSMAGLGAIPLRSFLGLIGY